MNLTDTLTQGGMRNILRLVSKPLHLDSSPDTLQFSLRVVLDQYQALLLL